MNHNLLAHWAIAFITSIGLSLPTMGFSSNASFEPLQNTLPLVKVNKPINAFSPYKNLKDNLLVGNLAGSFTVDQDGNAIYDIPLKASPGTAGMTPKLSLHYNSNASNGILGTGFSLNGLTAIMRTAQNYTQNGQIHGVDFSNNDRFILDGQQLVAINGTYGADGTEYRTYIDSQSRIISHGVQGNGPASFVVQTKGGQTAYYGITPDSQILAQGKNTNNIWALSKVVDQSGNYILYHYQQDSVNGAYYPSEIDYTGNDAAKVSPYNSLKFIYEKRPDVITSYTAGSIFQVTQRLKEIQAYHGTTLVYDYKIHYEQSPNTGKSRITSIQECDGQGECLKPLNFTWQTNQMGWVEAKQWTPSTSIVNYDTNPQAFSSTGATFFDVKSIGKPEYLHSVDQWQEMGNVMNHNLLDSLPWDNVLSSNSWLAGDAAQGWQDDGSYNPKAGLFYVDNFTNSGKESAALADLDGSGYPKLIFAVYAVNSDLGRSGYFSRLYDNTRVGWNENDNSPYNIPGNIVLDNDINNGAQFVDLHATGRQDLVQATLAASTPTITYLNTGSGWAKSTNYALPVTFNSYCKHCLPYGTTDSGLRWMNLTDSGLPDLTMASDNQQKAWINTGSGWQQADMYNPPSNFRFVINSGYGTQDAGGRAVSLLGDGLSDLIMGHDGNHLAWFNTGSGFASAPQYNPPVDIMQGSSDNGVVFADVTGSGLPALLQCSASNNSCHTWLNENGSWVEHDEYASPIQIVDRNSHDNGVRFIDLLGTGFPDIVFNNGSSSDAWLNKAQVKPDIITNIQDALGDNLQIQYKPITDDSVYTKGSSAQYPNMDLQAPIWVVSQTSSDTDPTPIPSFKNVASQLEKIVDQTQTQHVTTYHYANALWNHLGLGFLGFGQVTTTDQATGISIATTYSQDIQNHTEGLPVASVTTLSNGTIINKQNSYLRTKVFGNGQVNQTYYLPYVLGTTQISYDLNGDKLSSNDIETQIDDYNNPVSIMQTLIDNTGTYITQTTNVYQNDISANTWLLGELTYAQIRSMSPNGPSIIHASSYTYDKNTGLLASSSTLNADNNKTQLQNINSPDYLTKTYHRDAFGNIVQIDVSGIDIPTRSEKIQYDQQGRFILSKTNALNQTAQFETDPCFGVVVKAVDPNNLIETKQLDGLGRVIKVIHPDGTEDNIQYLWSADDKSAPSGSVYEVVANQTDSPIKISYHDELDREIAQATQGFDGRYIWQLSNYDQLGRLVGKTTPFYEGDTVYETTNQYDVLGRVILTTNPDQTKIQQIYNGYATTIINPNNQKTTRISNARGDLIETIDNEGNQTHYLYDAFDHLVQLTDCWNNITTMTYDNLGKKISMQDPDRGTWMYQYDALGELTKQTDPLNQSTEFKYDLLGRMIERTDLAGTNNAVTSAWQYDMAKHGIGKISQENGISAASLQNSKQLLNAAKQNLVNYSRIYSYDSLGRLSSTDTNLNGQDYIETTTYDKDSRPLVVTEPNKIAVKNIYNQLGYLIQAVDADTEKLYYQINSMDAEWHILSETHSNGLITNYSYDQKNNFLVGIQTASNSYLQIQQQLFPQYTHKSVNGWEIKTGKIPDAKIKAINKNIDAYAPIQKLSYAYDNLGNLLTKKDSILNIEDEYQYDDLNRLTQNATTQAENGVPTPIKTYHYDILGNIRNKNDVGQYYYDENDAGPHAVTSIKGNIENDTFKYDAAGNQTQAVIQLVDGPTITRNITYTSFDVPKSITQTNTATKVNSNVNFYYDANRNRFMRQDVVINRADISKTTTLYLGSLEIDTINNGQTTQATYKNYIGDTEIITDPQGNVHRYDILKDNIGSTNVITDEQGNVLQRFHYDPFGEQNLVNDAPSVSMKDDRTAITRYGFTGQEEVNAGDIDLIHMNGRMYDPHLGRFLSADPTIQDPSNSQSLNRYTYCLNNPLAYTDPTGFSWWSSLWKSVGHLFHSVGHAIDQVITSRIGGMLTQIALDAISVIQPEFIPLAVAYAGYRSYAQTGSVSEGLLSAAETGGSMAIMYEVGNIDDSLFHVAGNPNELKPGGWFGDAWMHGAAGGAINVAEGGDFKDGFLSSAIAQLMSGPISHVGDLDGFEAIPSIAARGMAAGIVGGTVAASMDGNFENAAWTAAYGEMFNDALHAYKYHYDSVESLKRALGTNGIVYGARPLRFEGSFMTDLNGNLSEYTLGDYHENIFWTDANGTLQNAGYFKHFGVVSDSDFPENINKYRFEPITHNHSMNLVLLYFSGFTASAYHIWPIVSHLNCQDFGEYQRILQHLPNYK